MNRTLDYLNQQEPAEHEDKNEDLDDEEDEESEEDEEKPEEVHLFQWQRSHCGI